MYMRKYKNNFNVVIYIYICKEFPHRNVLIIIRARYHAMS